jgi:DNA-binding CsgD family transcriptional regulator
MAMTPNSSSLYRKVGFELLEALGSSLDLRLVLERTYPLLTRLVPADYGALGVSASGRPEDFAWSVAEIPSAFFAAYPEMARHDFVRRAVAERPNVVLRDQDMVTRAELERNPMYRRAREVGAPLEQVMAVMLHVDTRWQSGLSLYRDRRRPFSIAERAALQRVTPALANAVRNCYLFEASRDWNAALESALSAHGVAILAAANGAQVARSAEAARLIDKWFALEACRGSALPDALAELVHIAAAERPPDRTAKKWCKRSAHETLEVSCIPWTTALGDGKYLLLLKERSQATAIPAVWRGLLTNRQQQVVADVRKGWDNRLIAAELGCAEGTVKKHLQSVFNRLGLASRAALIARANALDTERETDS